MNFTSFTFLYFFVALFAVYWAIPATWNTPVASARTLVLLVGSYYFYATWNQWLALLVAGTSLVDYAIALAMEKRAVPWQRKALLVGSIVMNLGLLFYFKYTNFFLGSLQSLLDRTGLHAAMLVVSLMAPIGISFYTFEAISYTVDVYHARARAERNPIHFLLFITFFPRMVAGPIIRARNFMPQVRREKRFSALRFRTGLEYVLMGLFKKMAIADNMARQSDPVFADPGKYCTGAVWLALLAYSLQIYCDFSGYSDIAVGLAHMLGFKLPENFNMPYLSKNISEFWRRWHISLSTWLRDYVFISMGGSRGSMARTVFTLAATMALCGLWHGAKWTFVAFGLMHGAFMVGNRVFHGFAESRPALDSFLRTAAGNALRMGTTWLAVAMGWVLFRAQDFGAAAQVYHRLFTIQPGTMVRTPVGPSDMIFPVVAVVAAHWFGQEGRWKRINERLSPVQWGLAYASLAVTTFLICPAVQQGFIYFQF